MKFRQSSLCASLLVAGALMALVSCNASGSTALPATKSCPTAGRRNDARLPKRLKIGTGNVGGVYFPYGSAISKAVHRAHPATDVEVVSTGGSVDNLQLLGSGDLNLGLTTVDAAADAWAGRAPYGSKVQICALAVLYTSYVHIVVPEASAIHSLRDLVGRRVSVGSALSSTEVTADRLLQAAGIDSRRSIQRVNQPLAESVAAMLDGELDALFWTGGVPTAAIVDLTTALSVRFLPTADYVASLRDSYGDVYRPFALRRGAYQGVAQDIRGIGVENLLVVRSDLPSSDAEQITAAIFADLASLRVAHSVATGLTVASASKPTSIPFHPGALRYYRSVAPKRS